MPNEIPVRLQQKLNERIAANALRSLRHYNGLIDFSSNDYLGLAEHPFIRARVSERLEEWGRTGSGGSRLLTGNHPAFEALEARIAAFHNAPAALLFGSGYEANSGLLSSVAGKYDTILYDSLCHASIREGIRISVGRSLSFRHNDPEDLEKKLSAVRGVAFVVTESVFSMDGDIAPLTVIAGICNKYNAYLIVDEAHATGVIGENGAGLVSQLQLEADIFARVYTFGKAMGQQGAAVLGSEQLRTYLVNFCRPFIYTTAPSISAVAAIDAAYTLLQNDLGALHTLQSLIRDSASVFAPATAPTAIRTVIVPGNDKVKAVAQVVQENGYLVLPVLSPTVPEGTERLRICLHAFNTMEEVHALGKLLHNTFVS